MKRNGNRYEEQARKVEGRRVIENGIKSMSMCVQARESKATKSERDR